jgi:hypothetical protein
MKERNKEEERGVGNFKDWADRALNVMLCVE